MLLAVLGHILGTKISGIAAGFNFGATYMIIEKNKRAISSRQPASARLEKELFVTWNFRI